MLSPRSLGNYWQQQAAVMDAIRRVGFAEYAASLPGLAAAFQLRDRWLRCIDEGCPGGVHLAGSGILLGIEEAVKVGKAAGVTVVTSHEECGAAKLAAQQAGVDAAKADEYGKEFAAQLAKRLGVSYVHLPLTEMARPAGLHVARVVYYDGSGSFDPSRLAGLPAGFVISRRYLDPAYAPRECEIAVSIALGEHGFGKLFTAAEPLIIVVIGHPSDPALSVGKLGAEVKPLAAQLGSRVAVDGFRAPAVANAC